MTNSFLNYIYKKLLVVSVFVSGLSSCSKVLDKDPETTLTDAAYWNTTSDLKSACNYLYNYLPTFNAFEDNMSDMATLKGTANSVSDGSRTTPATSSAWSTPYTLIRLSNTIIEKSANVSGDAALINRYVGEALFFRAWAYYSLLIRYGNVPLILQTFDYTDSLATAHSSDRSLVIQQIYDDLDVAASYLPGADTYSSTDYGRITKGAAFALESRAALFEGTRQKFFGYGTYSTHLNKCLAASDSLMNEKEYALYSYAAKPDSSYYYLFQDAGEGRANKENILVRLYGVDINNSISSNSFASYLQQAFTCPTRALMDNYLFTDGLPKDKSLYDSTETSTLTEFRNRDPRAGMTVYSRNSWYINGYYVPSFTFSPTGYLYNKYFIGSDAAIGNNQWNDLILLRYGEVLLNYAEAIYELNGSISDDDLNKSINLLRKRVNMPDLTNAFVSGNGLDMRTEIRRERASELALEGLRYWDLLRWKTAETALPNALVGRRYFPGESGTLSNPALTSDSLVVVQLASSRSFSVDRDYLWPIPTSELASDPNLVQNLNW